jgi:hypothetical protein
VATGFFDHAFVKLEGQKEAGNFNARAQRNKGAKIFLFSLQPSVVASLR